MGTTGYRRSRQVQSLGWRSEWFGVSHLLIGLERQLPPENLARYGEGRFMKKAQTTATGLSKLVTDLSHDHR